MNNSKELLLKLNSFDYDERYIALQELKEQQPKKQDSTGNVNLHFHTFFSYNAEGWSPSRIAYESWIRGLYATGIIDFDVLDGKNEFLIAGNLLNLRTSVGIETRAFLNEYADKEIDSPGEPGVSYIAGAGFVPDFAPETIQGHVLIQFKEKAHKRNKALINRINPFVNDIAIDYEMDVLPLTPSGNATERHIISAYINKSKALISDPQDLTNYWSALLEKPPKETAKLLEDRPALENKVRSKFAKRGGLAYVQPDENTFPKVEDFFGWVKSCGAIPMESWLDGTSEGEKDGKALLECSKEKGAMALNLIPERNWNITDPDVQKTKYQNLTEIISIANAMDLPIQIGTEMNKKGLPFTDDLSGKFLSPFKETFAQGAKILIGHTLLLRYAGFSYSGQEAESLFGNSVKGKNNFFANVGHLPPVSLEQSDKLMEMGKDKSFACIYDAVNKGKW